MQFVKQIIMQPKMIIFTKFKVPFMIILVHFSCKNVFLPKQIQKKIIFFVKYFKEDSIFPKTFIHLDILTSSLLAQFK